MQNTLSIYICIVVILFGLYSIIQFDLSRFEFFSPMNTYHVHDNSPPIQTAITKLQSTKPSTESLIPSTELFSSFIGKFPLTPAFIETLKMEFPEFSFNPEIDNLKISPDNQQFVFKISGITKSNALFVKLLVVIGLQNPLNYMTPDGEFFIPPNYDQNDFSNGNSKQ